MSQKKFLKSLFLILTILVLIVFGKAVNTFAASSPKIFLTDSEKKLNQLINYALERGQFIQRDGNNLVYLEKKEKIAENIEKRLYWTFHFIIWLNPNTWQAQIIVFQADCIIEEWQLKEGKYLINQKIIIDGGRFGELDGQADVIWARQIIETLDGIVLEIIDLPSCSPSERQKFFDNYLEEILKNFGL